MVKRRQVRDEDVDFERTWELGWWRKDFRTLKADQAFCALVTLTRAVNILRFVQGVVVSLPDTKKPEHRRQLMNSFYLSGAVLVEVEVLVNGIAKYFRESPEYRSLAAVVHSDDFGKVVARFRDLRRWSAFHFDEKAAQKVLATRDDAFERFLSSCGTLNKDYYYDLGDIVAFGVIAGTFDSPGQAEEWVKWFLDMSARVTNRVLDAADNFVASQIVDRWNAVKRQVAEGA